MNQETFSRVDEYFNEMIVREDAACRAAMQAGQDAGLPPISVTPNQGKLLYLLAKSCGARNILELGTLAGYSTLWLAKALPADGRILSLEVDDKCKRIAEANFRAAGVQDRIEVRLGPAAESLRQLQLASIPPFDLIFLDADKSNYGLYFDLIVPLTRPGTVLIADNIVRKGEVCNEHSADPSIQGVRQFNDRLAADERFDATAIQTVGAKGYDGFIMAVRVA